MQDRQALFQKNIATFQKYLPKLVPQILDYVPHARLIDVGDDDFDLEFQGQRFYNAGAKAHAADQVAHYRRCGARLTINPPSTGSLDAVSGRYVAHSLKRAVDAGIEFAAQPRGEECFHLVVFGIGLMQHMDPLLDLTKARSICVVDPNLEGLWQSLLIYDWEPLLQRNEVSPNSVGVFISSDPDDLARNVRAHCRYRSPVAVDWSLCLQHYGNSVLHRAMEIFRGEAGLMITGLGFLVDEMEMMRATYHNLKDGNAKIYRRLRADIRSPAFIIGSGPSLDMEFDFLREHQDTAVIFACGSSVGSLMANGIRPDFVLILENGDVNFELMSKIQASYDISGITLIASTTVSPLLKNVFKNIIYFQRSGLSSFAIFCDDMDNVLEEAGPTVTNTGLHSALEMGFREIYLLGVDLGGRHKDKHHSVWSPYTMEGRQAPYLTDEHFEFEGTLDRAMPGNFGGIVLADVNFVWSRDTMERMLRKYRVGHTVYNCSDGIRIEGTIPRVSASAEIVADPDAKKAALALIHGGMDTWTREDFERLWGRTDWREQVQDLLLELIDISSPPDQTYVDLGSRLALRLINDAVRQPTFAELILRGSGFLNCIVLDFYGKRAADTSRTADLQAILRDELIRSYRYQSRLIDIFFDRLPTATSPFLHADLITWVES